MVRYPLLSPGGSKWASKPPLNTAFPFPIIRILLFSDIRLVLTPALVMILSFVPGASLTRQSFKFKIKSEGTTIARSMIHSAFY